MAEVLLARATGIEGFTRHVVIKRIRPGQAKDQAFVQMFLNEARIAAQLHHANIVQVHDIGQEGNEYFFAMEYVHGEDLRRLLTHVARNRQKVPLEHVVTIISAAAVALHHAHEQRGVDRKPLGIVHRDVTPANILVGYDGNVKVVDFGIAKAAARTEETQAGTLKGKASYMSPEQCTGSKVDRRSDVFALGIVLYELVTARRLFKAENDFLTMSAIVGGKVPPARTHRPDLPDALQAIMAKALALKVEDRYQTADDMRDALEQFAADAGLRTSTSALAAYMKQQFGVRPEPWLVEEDDLEVEVVVDFDGSASAIVSPPDESLNQLAIPTSVEAMNSSPIVKARTKAITNEPAQPGPTAAPPKKPLPLAPPGVPPRKPLTAQIPILTTAPGSEKAKTFRIDTGPVPVPAPPRRKPKTVQIPITAQAAGMQAKESRGSAARLPPLAPSSGVPELHDNDSDSAVTTISEPSARATPAAAAVPRAIDEGWDTNPPPFATGSSTGVRGPAASTDVRGTAASATAGTNVHVNAASAAVDVEARGDAAISTASTTAARPQDAEPASTATPPNPPPTGRAKRATKTKTRAKSNSATVAGDKTAAKNAKRGAAGASSGATARGANAPAVAAPSSDVARATESSPVPQHEPKSSESGAHGRSPAARPTTRAASEPSLARSTNRAASQPSPAATATTTPASQPSPAATATTTRASQPSLAATATTRASQPSLPATATTRTSEPSLPATATTRTSEPSLAAAATTRANEPSLAGSTSRAASEPKPPASTSRKTPPMAFARLSGTAASPLPSIKGGTPESGPTTVASGGTSATSNSALAAASGGTSATSNSALAAARSGASASPGTGAPASPSTGAQALPSTGALAAPSTGAVVSPGTGASAAPSTGALASPGTGASAAHGTGASAAHGTGASAAHGTGAHGTGASAPPRTGASAAPSSGASAPPRSGAIAAASGVRPTSSASAITAQGSDAARSSSDAARSSSDAARSSSDAARSASPAGSGTTDATWSLADLAARKPGTIDNEASATSRFDVASLSSSRTDASMLDVPIGVAGTPSDSFAAAEPASDDDGPDGRDSAPSLPPPPTTRKSIRLPGIAQLPGDDADDPVIDPPQAVQPGSIAAKFAAPALPHARAKTPSAMPEAWPGGSSAVNSPRALLALLRSPRRIAIVAGALVVLVAIVVFATRGSDTRPSAAPDNAPVEPATGRTAAERATANTAEGATGEAATGETATGESATGEAATGEAATGEAATGEAATGEAATGEAVTGEAATGEAATGEAATGETATGETATADAPSATNAPEGTQRPRSPTTKPAVTKTVKQPARPTTAPATKRTLTTKVKPSTRPTARPAAKAKKPAKKAPAKKSAWDPNSLFPKKK